MIAVLWKNIWFSSSASDCVISVSFYEIMYRYVSNYDYFLGEIACCHHLLYIIPRRTQRRGRQGRFLYMILIDWQTFSTLVQGDTKNNLQHNNFDQNESRPDLSCVGKKTNNLQIMLHISMK